MPGDLFLPTAGPLGTLIAITIAVIIMSIIPLSYGYMVNRFPVAGGEFAFSFIGFNRVHAFICSWFLGLSYLAIVPLNATALGMIGRFMFPGVLQRGYLYSIAGWEVYLGEVILSSAVLILMISTIVDPNVQFSNLAPVFPTGKPEIPGILSIVAIAPWAFVGFDAIPQASEEFNFSPSKTLRLMIISIITGGLIYVTMNTITAVVLPWESHLGQGHLWPTWNAIELLLGDFGMLLLGIALTSAILAGIMGFYMASSRLILSMARAHALPSVFAEITPDTKTPKNAILFVMVFSLMAPWFGREVLLWIVDMASIGAAIGYFYTCASAYLISNRTDKSIVVKIYSALGAIFSFIFALLLLIPSSPAFLSLPSRIALIILIILGILFYFSTKYVYLKLDRETLSKKILGE